MPRAGLTPERVIDAAVAIADRDGTEAVTLAQVAADVGVRTPSLYNHVAGLDDLRRQLGLRAYRELGQRLQRAAVGRAGADAVRAIATEYRAFSHAHPGLYPFLVPTIEGDDRELHAAGAPILETVLAALRGYDLGDDPVHAARALRSAIHGFVDLERAGGFGRPTDLDASFTWLVEAMIAGFEA